MIEQLLKGFWVEFSKTSWCSYLKCNVNNDATTQRLHYKNQLEKTETGNIWNAYVKIWSEPSKPSFFGKKNPHLGFSQEQKLDYEKKIR